MIYFAASLGLQLLCAIHVIRTGRNQLWLFVILFFSLLGCFAYFLIEVLPAHGGNRYVRHARAKVGETIAPERQLRAAQDALELSDTAANRIALGDAFAALGRHGEAVPCYRQANDMMRGGDPATVYKLARSLFETGAPAETLRLLDALPEAMGSVADQRNHLRARALAETGADSQARALFEDVITRLPGDEARCHFAHFLIERGDRRRAREILEEVERRAKRLHRLQRVEAAEMYRWAAAQLKDLREG